MTEQLFTDIEEQIKQHLPQQVGEVLKKELDRLKNLEKELGQYKDKYRRLENELELLRDSNKDLIKENIKAKTIIEREKALEVKEINLRVEMLKHQLKCSDDTNSRVMLFVDSLMRNTEFRKNRTITHMDEYDNAGNYRKIPTGDDTSEQAE